MERMSIATEALDLVNLTALMELTSGDLETVIGLIDGPVLTDHPDLASATTSAPFQERRRADAPGLTMLRACTEPSSQGFSVQGWAQRAPAICPGCTSLNRPLFSETTSGNELLPSAIPETLAAAIIECVDAGARLVNPSAALVQ